MRREVRAENVSMHALTRRGMSRWELEKTLLSRELDADVVGAELDRLEGVGLLDDAALAETFVRTQHDRKGLGRGALTAELRRRHIDQEHIDAALEQVDDDDEQTRATELAVKRAGQLSSYDLETAKRRLHGFLARKGYSSGVVRAAVDEALSARSSGVRFR
jgi:regulatory protein